MDTALLLRIIRRLQGSFEGNPTSEDITDESGNILTDESLNAIQDSGA